FDLRSDLYGHIQHLPLTWFDNRATGDLMTRVLEDVTSVERMLIDGIEQGIVALLQVFVVSAMLFFYNAKLAALALVPLPLLAVLHGELQLGELVAFIALAGFLYDPIGRLHQLNQLFQAGRAAGERVFEIMDEKPEPGGGIAETGLRIAKSIAGDVRFQNVCF